MGVYTPKGVQMLTATDRLARAISSVGSEEFPVSLRHWMGAVVPSDNIALLAYFQDRKPEILFAESTTPEVHADLEDSYLNGAYLLDPLHELHLRQVDAGMYRMSDIAPDHFHRNQYYIEYYAKTTMVDEIAFVSYPNEGVTLQLCLGRDRASNKKFSPRQLKEAHALHPVVSALMNRQWSGLETFGSYNEGGTIDNLIANAEGSLNIGLTRRQAEIVFLVLKGHSSNSIALRLDIAYQTVKVFRRQIYKKCQISSQAELFSLFVPLLTPG